MSASKDGNPHDAGTLDAAPIETVSKPKKKARGRAADAPRKPRRRNRSPKEDAKTKARRERMAEALEYRSRGYKYREIGDAMGIDVATAYRLVQQALSEIPRENAEELRMIELERIDTMTTKLMDQFLENPDPMYMDGVLKLMAARAKYLGLFDLPKGDDPRDPRGGSAGGGMSFSDSMKLETPQLQLPPPTVLRPDEPVPLNPVL